LLNNVVTQRLKKSKINAELYHVKPVRNVAEINIELNFQAITMWMKNVKSCKT